MRVPLRGKPALAKLVLLAGLACVPAEARVGTIPLPPKRPPEFAAPKPAALPGLTAPQRAPPLSAGGDDAETCAAVLSGGKVVAEQLPAVHAGLCGIERPLLLKAILVAEKRQIKLEPPVTLRCGLAGTIASWVIEDLTPAVDAAGQPLAALSGVGAYECRGRNGVAGAKLSEHAIGNALDIGGLKLADGRVIDVQQLKDNRPMFDRMGASACARFATVLGPGADAFHKSHVHVDLQVRRNGNKLCQWELVPSSPPGGESAR
ncbi:MAG: hypothetical protein QOF41_1717 [Methylobacteriaceae bacterium]|nr:hypothetical protein [Methylobacteriaceae bacterium]